MYVWRLGKTRRLRTVFSKGKRECATKAQIREEGPKIDQLGIPKRSVWFSRDHSPFHSDVMAVIKQRRPEVLQERLIIVVHLYGEYGLSGRK